MAYILASNPNTSHICSNLGYDIRRKPKNECHKVRKKIGRGWSGLVLQCSTSESKLSFVDEKVGVEIENGGGKMKEEIVEYLAEVLSGLLYKLKHSPPNRYACVVAEPAENDEDSPKQVVGVVDITALRDRDVLQQLPAEAEEYLYISGIAVSNAFRRKKIGSALLKACDKISNLWGFEFLALRAYEEDFGARKLYTNAGYQVVSKDPPWTSNWIGRKCRVLMIKRTSLSE